MNTNLNTSLFNLEKDLPQLNKTHEKLHKNLDKLHADFLLTLENKQYRFFAYLQMYLCIIKVINFSHQINKLLRKSFKTIKGINEKLKLINSDLPKLGEEELKLINSDLSDLLKNDTISDIPFIVYEGKMWHLKDLSKFLEEFIASTNNLLENVESYKFESKIVNALPLLSDKLIKLFGLKDNKEECKKLRELINDSFDILDIFFALIGHEPTQEDVEKVYKDYAVDNETDYVFKTQISKESIEKIETSSLSKLSLEDIRLGRF